MNNVKRVNALLWTGNVVLIVGIVAFAFQFLILQEAMAPEVDAPISVPQMNNKGGGITDTRSLKDVPNPLKPDINKPPDPKSRGPIRLIGIDRIASDPASDTAYLEIVSRKLNVNAYVGEPIRDESVGQEVSELAGWRLKSVTPTTAVFATPQEDVTLKLDEITAAPAGPVIGAAMPGGKPAVEVTAWERAKYASKKNETRSDDNREAWDIDRKEVEWAGANWESVLQGVSLEPYSGGGLKINSLPDGSYAADRGFRSGDVIKVVNNQSIDSIARLQDVMKSMARNQTTLNVVVDRSGRLYTLQYSVQPNVRR